MPRNTLLLALVCVIALQVGGITVRPSRCPTNKIAPHKRSIGWDEAKIRDQSDGRTFGAYYDLLVPERFQNQNDEPSSLQESPQNDPEDCGDIEDYDENDLSSLNPSTNRRLYGDNRFFLGSYFNRPQRPNKHPAIPSTTFRPRPGYPQKRPPQGGYFGQNAYTPQMEQDPSVYVKPVNEDNRERPQLAYRPSGVVGVPLGHIVGMNSIVPSEPPPTTKRPRPPPRQYLPIDSVQQYPDTKQYLTRRERPRTINNNDSVLGSFVDLLFK